MACCRPQHHHVRVPWVEALQHVIITGNGCPGCVIRCRPRPFVPCHPMSWVNASTLQSTPHCIGRGLFRQRDPQSARQNPPVRHQFTTPQPTTTGSSRRADEYMASSGTPAVHQLTTHCPQSCFLQRPCENSATAGTRESKTLFCLTPVVFWGLEAPESPPPPIRS